jgi:hypothetical protein
MFQSWEIDNQGGINAFEFCIEKDNCCFMTLPTGTGHPFKGLSKETLQFWKIFT